MPKPPLISIPLDIPDVRVLQTELTKDGEFILTVESTLTSTSCRRCGRTITERHGLDEPRLLRHLPILGRVVYLRIRPKRFRCPANAKTCLICGAQRSCITFTSLPALQRWRKRPENT